MLQAITFDKQLFTSRDFAHLQYTFLDNKDCVTKGCEISQKNGAVTIGPGYFFASGRMLKIVGSEVVNPPSVISGTLYCVVVFEIDLNQENTEEEFKQGSIKVLTNSTNYQEPTKEDLHESGKIYQMPFCRYKKTVDGVEGFEDLTKDYKSPYTVFSESLEGKALKDHNHDGRYFTESEVKAIINNIIGSFTLSGTTLTIDLDKLGGALNGT